MNDIPKWAYLALRNKVDQVVNVQLYIIILLVSINAVAVIALIFK